MEINDSPENTNSKQVKPQEKVSCQLTSKTEDRARRAKNLKRIKSNLYEDTLYAINSGDISSDIPDEVLQWLPKQCMYDRLKNRSGSRGKGSPAEKKVVNSIESIISLEMSSNNTSIRKRKSSSSESNSKSSTSKSKNSKSSKKDRPKSTQNFTENSNNNKISLEVKRSFSENSGKLQTDHLDSPRSPSPKHGKDISKKELNKLLKDKANIDQMETKIDHATGEEIHVYYIQEKFKGYRKMICPIDRIPRAIFDINDTKSDGRGIDYTEFLRIQEMSKINKYKRITPMMNSVSQSMLMSSEVDELSNLLGITDDNTIVGKHHNLSDIVSSNTNSNHSSLVINDNNNLELKKVKDIQDIFAELKDVENIFKVKRESQM